MLIQATLHLYLYVHNDIIFYIIFLIKNDNIDMILYCLKCKGLIVL